ncbi:MAG: hypothetical protein KAS72_11855 [Phycisphaerales bacterium]|nr:hypothetical protein [Phycisphaerales bacterium]
MTTTMSDSTHAPADRDETTHDVDAAECGRRINTLLASEARSLFRYFTTQPTYTEPRTVPVRRIVDRIARDGERHERFLTKLLLSLEGDPALGSFTIEGTYINYITWDRLLPDLMRDKKQQIARYESVLSALAALDPHDSLACHICIADLLEENREHLQALGDLG